MRRTLRVASLLAVLLVWGCSAPPRGEPGDEPRVKRQTDQLCLNDCLGSGGSRSFCDDRCTN